MEKSNTQKQSEQPTTTQRFYTVKNRSQIQTGIPGGTGLAVKFVNRNLAKRRQVIREARGPHGDIRPKVGQVRLKVGQVRLKVG